MKKTLIILSTLFFFLQTLQAQQPRFTEFRTAEERENEEWQNKITDEAELKNYILQLVTSREKSDYGDQWVCVQIFEKTTGKFVQEIDLSEYNYMPTSGGFSGDDYNFDGNEDFSIWGGYFSFDNGVSSYFLFDPETKTFFDGGFYDTNLEFHSSTKTITSSNRCCAGTSVSNHTYKLVDNRMVVVEQHCLEAIDEEGNILTNEYLIFEEVDCYTPYLDIQLQSVGLKQNFQLRMAIYDEDMAGGFVLYKGQKERIPIHFHRSEDIQEDESYPDGSHAKLFYYNEMYKGEINGVYTFTLLGASIVDDAYYIRKKDGKIFTLRIVSQ